MGHTCLPSAGCGPRLGGASVSSKGSPSSTTRSPWSPEAFEGPLCTPAHMLFPVSQAFALGTITDSLCTSSGSVLPVTDTHSRSSQIRQKYSTELEAASTAWPACICGRPHLPLDHVALEGWGRFFLELAEKHEGAERLFKMQTQRGGRLLLQDERKPPEMSGHNSGRHASRPAWERSLTRALLGPQTFSSDSWRTTSGPRPQAGRGESLPKAPPQARLGAPGARRPLRAPLQPLVSGSCLSFSPKPQPFLQPP
ncbi:hypothetical protein QTO34_011330 [Cnephaeus nilssonii]|uniref:Ferritin light chain n=1 Tax=Cnephaeus nilssonii TaxID=3371016 RepID=A0AA40HEC7_CNENI|nr:hypothetical protein QTO34_011330 [Eptesicus nilssonii]